MKFVKGKHQAYKFINKAFGRGFTQIDNWGAFKERISKWRKGKESFLGVCKGFGRLFIRSEYNRLNVKEKGYAYFQDFVPDCNFDIRIIVISGNKAFAIKRLCRKNDFRASGSGNVIYAKSEIDERCVAIGFEVAKKLQSQSLALDFIFFKGQPLIVELSYGFSPRVYDSCEGFWSDDMKWHEGPFDFEGWMVQDLMRVNSTQWY